MSIPSWLVRYLSSEWDATEQPIEQRGNVLPLGVYGDGSVHPAWPGFINDGIEGFNSLWDRAAIDREGLAGTFDPELGKEAAGGSLMAAGLAATGGLAAGVVPENALATVKPKPSMTADEALSVAFDRPSELRVTRATSHGKEHLTAESPHGQVESAFDPRTGSYRILGSRVDETSRGQGHGIALYQALVDEAHKAGLPVISDWSVSKSAQNIYDALQRRGYKVAENPGAIRSKHTDAKWGPADAGGGVYRVDPPNQDFPGLFSNPRTAPLAPAAVNALDNSASHLPMDQASRLARAREMGFDTETPLYHGSQHDIDAFDLGLAEEGWRGRAVHTSTDPNQAAFYGADGRDYPGAVYPLYGKMQNTADYNGLALPREALSDAQYEKVVGEWGNAIKESGLLVPFVMDALGGDKTIGILKSLGYDSLKDGPHHAIFDPRNIRSVNATFDPAKADSANLLAANPRTAPLAPAAVNALERKPFGPGATLVDEIDGMDLVRNFDPREQRLSYHMIDGSGDDVGVADVHMDDNFMNWVSLNPALRGNGIGTKLYNAIEYDRGRTIHPSPEIITDEALKFWIRRDPRELLKSQSGSLAGYSTTKRKIVSQMKADGKSDADIERQLGIPLNTHHEDLRPEMRALYAEIGAQSDRVFSNPAPLPLLPYDDTEEEDQFLSSLLRRYGER